MESECRAEGRARKEALLKEGWEGENVREINVMGTEVEEWASAEENMSGICLTLEGIKELKRKVKGMLSYLCPAEVNH